MLVKALYGHTCDLRGHSAVRVQLSTQIDGARVLESRVCLHVLGNDVHTQLFGQSIPIANERCIKGIVELDLDRLGRIQDQGIDWCAASD